MATYRDFTLAFHPHPMTEDLSTVSDANAVMQSLRNLILTNQGERPFRPDLGGNIQALLFELQGPSSFIAIQNEIKYTLKKYEPRADIKKVAIEASPADGKIKIHIAFALKNRDEVYTLQVAVDRLR